MSLRALVTGRAPLPAFLVAGGAAIALGCGPSAPVFECVKGLDLACAPLYDPTFDQVFNRTLHPTCAQPGSNCHASEGAKGGLVFEDASASFALLMGDTDGRARVIAGDAACSLIVERLASADLGMPPGGPLSDAERCAIVQWIEAGAKR